MITAPAYYIQQLQYAQRSKTIIAVSEMLVSKTSIAKSILGLALHTQRVGLKLGLKTFIILFLNPFNCLI